MLLWTGGGGSGYVEGMDRIATWGQLPNESEQAFAAFKVYRNLGSKRSLRRTAREVGKCRTLMERWSKRHQWQARIANWDCEQDDLKKEAHIQAIAEAENRHGTIARALLGHVAAELGKAGKKRCESCGRLPIKLTPSQIATAMKAGVEVERLSLGLATAGAPVINASTTMNVVSGTTALVLLRDGETQRMASDLLARMKSLDPATSLRRLAGASARAAIEEGGANGAEAKPPTGRAAVKAAAAEAEAARARRVEEAKPDPSGPDRSAADELGAFDDEEHDDEDLF